MSPTESPSWHPDFLIFNDSMIGQSKGDARWLTLRTADRTSETRKPLASVPRWTLDLSDLQLSAEQHEELLAFGYEVQGMLNPFLIRNIRNCTLEDVAGNASVIGVGNGSQQTFQLSKARPIQGRAGYREIVRFPNVAYPYLHNVSGDVWDELPELAIWVNDSYTANYDVNRTTGAVTFNPPSGAIVSATGGHYTLMIANQDGIPTTPDAGCYIISEGISFAEPVGGADAELTRMGLL